YLTSTQAVLSLLAKDPSQSSAYLHSKSTRGTRERSRAPKQTSVLRMTLLGADPGARISGGEQRPGNINYFLGNDPGQWRVGAGVFGKVKYSEVYPGVDLVFYGNQRQLEYDFIVGAGARPDQIGLDFSGADRLEVDADGALVAYIGKQTVHWKKPFA